MEQHDAAMNSMMQHLQKEVRDKDQQLQTNSQQIQRV